MLSSTRIYFIANTVHSLLKKVVNTQFYHFFLDAVAKNEFLSATVLSATVLSLHNIIYCIFKVNGLSIY